MQNVSTRMDGQDEKGAWKFRKLEDSVSITSNRTLKVTETVTGAETRHEKLERDPLIDCIKLSSQNRVGGVNKTNRSDRKITGFWMLHVQVFPEDDETKALRSCSFSVNNSTWINARIKQVITTEIEEVNQRAAGKLCGIKIFSLGGVSRQNICTTKAAPGHS